MQIAWNPQLSEYLSRIPRTHPWTVGATDSARYYDFKKHPELIREALEDFRQLDGDAAGEAFYRLVEWLNGEDSLFESNDCLLRRSSPANPAVGARSWRGHVTIFFRDVRLNAESAPVNWLRHRVETLFRLVDPSFSDGRLDFAFWPTLFSYSPGPIMGHALHLRFEADGRCDTAALKALARSFTNIFSVVVDISREAGEVENFDHR